MPDAVARFAGFAAEYDAARPQPPAELTEVLMQWSGTVAPDVVDLGAGTGLSAAIWAGRARRVTAVEPGARMRTVAMTRLGLTQDPAGARRTRTTPPAEPTVPAAGAPTRFAVVAGSAEETGLPDACADIVTASQAMHWFDAARALPEIARILRPGGVFAAYDCDWPPCIDWETDAAYVAFDRRVRDLETARGLLPPHAGKGHHVETIAGSGLFRFATEVALLSREQGDAKRLVDVALEPGRHQGAAGGGRDRGRDRPDRAARGGGPDAARARPWWWTYRVRMGVR